MAQDCWIPKSRLALSMRLTWWQGSSSLDDDSQSRPMHLSSDEDAAAVQVTTGLSLSTF